MQLLFCLLNNPFLICFWGFFVLFFSPLFPFLWGLRTHHALTSHYFSVDSGHSWNEEKEVAWEQGAAKTVVPSCHFSIHQSSRQCAPVLGWHFQEMMRAFGALCLVFPAVFLLLSLRPLNCYPPPLSVYCFSHDPSACSRVGFLSLFIFPRSGFREKYFTQACICPQEKEPWGALAANLC